MKAEECIFIDDSLKNTESAASLGFYVLHVGSVGTNLTQEQLGERIGVQRAQITWCVGEH